MDGMRLPYALCQALWQACRDGGRMWYGGGWLWCHGHGHVTRMQHRTCDFGLTARFDVPAEALRKVRKDGYAVLTPSALSVYARDGSCTSSMECVPTNVVYKWEMYMEPGVRATVACSGVSALGMGLSCAVSSAAVPEGRCGFVCERVEDAHNTVRTLAEGDEWTVEGLVFVHEELEPRGRVR